MEFLLAVVSCRGETQCVGNVHNVGSTRVARIARVQFNSTLERKIKIGALKGIFLVCKWINNTVKSNSVRYHMHHRKNLSFLSSFGLHAVFDKGSKIAVFLSIVTSKRAR